MVDQALQEIAFFFIFLGYIFYGLFAHYQRGMRHAQMRALRRKVVKMKQEDFRITFRL